MVPWKRQEKGWWISNKESFGVSSAGPGLLEICRSKAWTRGTSISRTEERQKLTDRFICNGKSPVSKFIWETRKKETRHCSLDRRQRRQNKQREYPTDQRSSSARHERAVLWELWGGAGWSCDQAAHHSAHAQVQRGLPRRIPQNLTQGFSTRVASKLPAAVQEAADEPQHQPPEAPLHSGPHAQVVSLTVRPRWRRGQWFVSYKATTTHIVDLYFTLCDFTLLKCSTVSIWVQCSFPIIAG